MDHFLYRRGRLYAEDVPVEAIANTVGTPVYVYATATLRRHYHVFAEAVADLDATICYAVKANGNRAVVRTLARLGAGADVVSGGELQVALTAGVPPERIVFSGVGKSERELADALKAGVGQINVESLSELHALSVVGQALCIPAPVALRVNPDVDARTHDKISTGRRENKFGIEWTAAQRVYAEATRLPAITPIGIAAHIGSQLTDLDPFAVAFRRLRDLVIMLRADGYAVTNLDLGGGLGIPYGDEATPVPGPADYAATIRATVGDLGCRLILEPGRLLVGNAGVLLTRILHVKEGDSRTFVIVDAGMNDLMRPALYGARHPIVPVVLPAAGAPQAPVDVVGPICETSDTFASGVMLPAMRPGTLLAIRGAGAYGAVMASSYNVRPLVAEVLVRDGVFAVVRERITVDDLLERQPLPSWLADEPIGADDAAVPAAGSG